MGLFDLFLQQLTDPFRIGLLAMLMATTARTEADTGLLIPLVLGVGFVAVLLPTAFGAGEAGTVAAIGVGVAANAVLVGVMLAGLWAWRRFAGRSQRRD